MRKRESGQPAVGYEPGAAAQDGYVFNKLLIVRLVLASLLFAAALILKMSALLTTVLLAVSAVIAGYDVVMQAVNDASAKDFFGASMIVTFVAVVSFAIGFGHEGAALVILYQIGLLLIDYTSARTKGSALDFIPPEDDDILTHVSLLFESPEVGKTPAEEKLRRAMGLAAKVILAAAVVYAVVLPLVGDSTYTVSIHRALTLMVIATPISVLASLRLTDVVGIGFAAANGVVYNNSASFDMTRNINAVVFDKQGVFTNGQPRVSSVRSDKLPPETFLKIAAHICYKSADPMAKAVTAAYGGEIMPRVADDFAEVPGLGAEIRINGISLCLGTAHFITSMGVSVPAGELRGGQTLYMSIADRYVGSVSLTEDVAPEAGNVVSELTDAGVGSCVLMTGDGSDESAKLAKTLGISEFYSGCDENQKLAAVEDCSKGVHDGRSLYIFGIPADVHSAADIDACVGANSVNADVFLTETGLGWLPAAMSVSGRALTVSRENIALAIIIKVLVIALALTGRCNIWFAVFLDMAAALGAILNTIRVSMPPLFTIARKR